MKAKAAVFILFVILLGCQKGSNPKITLNGALTNCPTCTFNYYDNADIANGAPVPGNYRVFWYGSITPATCGPTSQFYFKTPLNENTDFDIASSQIAAGEVVAYSFQCPCCYIENVAKPIGGEIKGQRADATHWLINATIILGVSINQTTDTLVVNQYFTKEKLP
jgi:hypothetical protein